MQGNFVRVVGVHNGDEEVMMAMEERAGGLGGRPKPKQKVKL